MPHTYGEDGSGKQADKAQGETHAVTGTLQSESSGVRLVVFDCEAMDFIDLEERPAPTLTTGELSRETKLRLSAVQRRDPEESAFNPRAALPLRGLTFDAIARQHMMEPRMATRGALLSKPIITRADALAGIDLIACLDGDSELLQATAKALRQYLDAD
jgi:hypothetical protein